jgi:phage antirepressor YoqD-like protein
MLAIANKNLTMTSLEISELVNSRHDKVKQSIDRLSSDNEHRPAIIKRPPMGEVKNHLGQSVSVFFINKRDSYIIVAQLSPEFTAALVDRWQELENKNNPMAIAATMNSAQLSVLMAETQAKELALERLALAQPAVAFVERYVQSTGNLGFRQVCKLLKAKENDFRQFLSDMGIMYRLGGEWVPYATHIDAGRFYVTTGTGDNDHNFTSAKFTPKGVEWIAKLWGKK